MLVFIIRRLLQSVVALFIMSALIFVGVFAIGMVGVIGLPALGRTLWAATGQGAFCNGDRIAVSTATSLADATLLTSDYDRARARHEHDPSPIRQSRPICAHKLAKAPPHRVSHHGRADATVAGCGPWTTPRPWSNPKPPGGSPGGGASSSVRSSCARSSGVRVSSGTFPTRRSRRARRRPNRRR